MVKLFLKEIENAKTHSKEFARKILSEHLNADPNSLAICKNEFGKPYLKNYPDIHYNISHTKGAIVCAVSDQPIGIDIERIKKLNKRIAERFFTKNEQNYIFSDKEKQNEKFIEIWTMKEAYVKWLGKGMEIPFASYDVESIDNIVSFNFNDYIVSVCSNRINGTNNSIIKKKLKCLNY
jgi:4'-phosphopantetheinyl transferase